MTLADCADKANPAAWTDRYDLYEVGQTAKRGGLKVKSSGAPRIVFVSCNETAWGGSEELWARAALRLAEAGVEVRAAKPIVDHGAAPVRALAQRGIKVIDLARIGFLPRKLATLLKLLFRPASMAIQLIPLWWLLWRSRPDLVVLSQGGNWDGIHMGMVLQRFTAPYVLICQKATDLYWPPDHLRAKVRTFAQGARHIFFVSQHNHRLFEEQVGAALPRSSVVRNPFLVDYVAPLPWPAESGPARFACVGRLYPMEKGQDMLLRVLARPKWRARDLTVDFYGSGIVAEGLAEMARFLGCENVTFNGHVEDVTEIWQTHHALILPSRAEGLPLVLIEAMLAGRVAVVSKAGGSAEVVDDGASAFLMAGQDEEGLDESLERAWQARDRWPDIGAAAAQAIRQLVPPDPAAELARQILNLARATNNAVSAAEPGLSLDPVGAGAQ